MARKMFLTGRPGCGKTTAIQKILDRLTDFAGGFSTGEIRSGGRRLGFRVTDLRSGEEGVLAHVDRKGRPRVSKYGVDIAAFERIGVGALRDALGRDGLIVIDEVGKMELFSGAFQDAVAAALDSDQPVLGTVTRSRHPFLERLKARDNVEIITVSPSNRDDLPARLAAELKPGACD
ncbi:MAG: NTPase [Planctomycetota bacterium]